ncbi:MULTISPECIES: DUF4400 domain-containing protein [Vibrio]|uniref:DUF4400 domain-containing protein n=2 Tax=Vibrio TaxID=662 RepID=A0A510IF29_9VIBR|nr:MULTISPECIES: DUF4400 domain-containing protein [Vibrio]RTZ23005.1 DUF4400 domain-containing protein [Vibrio penaeicida]BBL92319.1 hypothetical protein VroAM7_49720 [Vibrio rotiferianus]GLQ71065.1 hypothetical protein GCM10007932_04250 [Vibrio penaeicida]
MSNLTSSWWVYLILWALQVILVILFVNPEQVRKVVTEEYRKTELWLGKENTEQLYAKATGQYKQYIIKSKFKEVTYDIFLPRNVEMENKGMERLRQASFWDLVKDRLDSLFLLLKTILFRAKIFINAFLLSCPYLLPVIVDGLMRREVLKISEENASLNLYTVCKKVFLGCLFIPFFMLFWPWAISPIYLLVWTVFMAFTLWIVASHVQHRI